MFKILFILKLCDFHGNREWNVWKRVYMDDLSGGGGVAELMSFINIAHYNLTV